MSLKDIMQRIESLQQELKTEMNKELDNVQEMEGVRRVGKGMTFVSFKNLSLNSLSPEYYDSKLQAEHIKKQLSTLTDMEKVKNKIQSYIDSGKVTVSKGYDIILNDKVLNVLKGIYAEI